MDHKEAATRVPVQGEPNDDREALLRVMRQAGFAEHLHEDMREKVLEAWADEFVGEGIGLSRATVPDAATAAIERVRAAVERHKHWNEDCGWDVPAIEVLAALDGAPEPEWEYGCDTGMGDEPRAHSSQASAESDASGVSSREYPDGRVEEFSRHVMRRRKAGLWEVCE